jgi:hypothetical protein
MAKSKVSMGQIDLLAAAINAAMQQASSYGTRFKLREILRTLSQHAQDGEAEKQTLVEKFAERGEDGKPVIVEDLYQFGDNQAEVDRQWAALQATQMTISHKLTLDDVADLPADPAFDALELLLLT